MGELRVPGMTGGYYGFRLGSAFVVAVRGASAPQERDATVLFTDIERFTQIAASLMRRHRGVSTQFQGDAVPPQGGTMHRRGRGTVAWQPIWRRAVREYARTPARTPKGTQ